MVEIRFTSERPYSLITDPHTVTAAGQVVLLLEVCATAIVPPTPLLRTLECLLLTWLSLVETYDDQLARLSCHLTDDAVVEYLHLLTVRWHGVLGLTTLFDLDDFWVRRR